MDCQLCGAKCEGNVRYCGDKCITISRLRYRGTQELLKAEEHMYREGYDTIAKRTWVRNKLLSISAGEQDNEMYLMFLRRETPSFNQDADDEISNLEADAWQEMYDNQ